MRSKVVPMMAYSVLDCSFALVGTLFSRQVIHLVCICFFGGDVYFIEIPEIVLLIELNVLYICWLIEIENSLFARAGREVMIGYV
jgi:hypothetical protein